MLRPPVRECRPPAQRPGLSGKRPCQGLPSLLAVASGKHSLPGPDWPGRYTSQALFQSENTVVVVLCPVSSRAEAPQLRTHGARCFTRSSPQALVPRGPVTFLRGHPVSGLRPLLGHQSALPAGFRTSRALGNHLRSRCVPPREALSLTHCRREAEPASRVSKNEF